MKFMRPMALAGASIPLVLGGSAALAPAASAATTVGSSACNRTEGYNDAINTNNVNFRTGPGTTYGSLRQLNRGAKVYVYCAKVISYQTDAAWTYVRYNATGQKAWVYADYLTTWV